MAYGSHASATQYYDFLRTEMADMARLGYWTVLPYRLVRLLLRRLRLSPAGVVPQCDRRPRTIIDYTTSNVNAETLRLSPKEAMQFGRALHRLLRQIRFAPPQHGPVYMLKVDLSDGFYRVWLRPSDAPVLGVAFPSLPDEEPLVAFPLVLPMGWCESPPYFCALTETIADLTNDRIAAHWDPPPHPLEDLASTQPAPLPGYTATSLPSPTRCPSPPTTSVSRGSLPSSFGVLQSSVGPDYKVPLQVPRLQSSVGPDNKVPLQAPISVGRAAGAPKPALPQRPSQNSRPCEFACDFARPPVGCTVVAPPAACLPQPSPNPLSREAPLVRPTASPPSASRAAPPPCVCRCIC